MKSHVFFICCVLIAFLAGPAGAEKGTDSAFRSTAYPLPRFVSISASRAFVRAGPGEQFPIKWEFRQKDLPVEIILEFDHWRKIRDYEEAEGWIHKSLLAGKRTGLILADQQVAVRNKPEEKGRLVAYMEPMVVVDLEECIPGWCRVDVSGFKGWTERQYIWGVYEKESF